MTWPTFFIVGANKAGTTALYYHLRQHPQIWMSRVKEPQHFASKAARVHGVGPGDERAVVVQSTQDYQALFKEGSGSRARGEASTIYLYDRGAPHLIHSQLPDSKIVAILRDPADRAYSNYLHLRRDGREDLDDFEAALDAEAGRLDSGWSANWAYLDKGFYADQIRQYLRVFPSSQLRWYSYDQFNSDPTSTLRDLYSFLEVDAVLPEDLSLRLNVGGVPKRRAAQSAKRLQEKVKWALDPILPNWLRRWGLQVQARGLSRPMMPTEARERLLRLYREDIVLTGELTGLDVAPWLRVGPSHAAEQAR